MIPRTGPEFTMRYNLHRCAQINVSGKDGVSSYQVMAALEDVFAKTMPREMGFDYKDIVESVVLTSRICYSFICKRPDPARSA